MNLLLYSFIISLLWGIAPILYKLILKTIDIKTTFIINNIFFTLGVIMYTIYYWNDFCTDIKSISTKEIFLIGAISFSLSFIPNIIYYNLLKHHDSSIVTALVNSSPIFTVAISYLLFGNKISNCGILGIILIVSGIACLSN